MNNIEVEKVSTYCYLGVTLEFDLNSDSIIMQLSAAGSRTFGQIIGKTRSNYDLGFSSFTQLFNSCVIPILDYAVGVWGTGKNTRKLDQVQEHAYRYYSGVPKTCPLAALNGDYGWTPGIVRRDIETIHFYNQ